MDDQFIRCPTCRRRFANSPSFDAHRAHGRCTDPRSLGQAEVFSVFYIRGTARQVHPWADPEPEPSKG